MIQYQRLYLIGSSHISPESVKEVKKVIKEVKPSFVAVELDKGRLHSLLDPNHKKLRLRDVRQLGFRGFLFAMFGAWVENSLGKVVKTKPGSEMKAAVHEAAKMKAKVVLIDQDIRVTIKRLFKQITFREKLRFFGDIVKGLFGFGKVEVQFDLRKVPEEKVITQLVDQVRVRYPSVYMVLIHERNKVMARKLHRLMTKFPDKDIVAVVGAGHVRGMIELLEKAKGDASSSSS